MRRIEDISGERSSRIQPLQANYGLHAIGDSDIMFGFERGEGNVSTYSSLDAEGAQFSEKPNVAAASNTSD